jgi:hypothetical protein
MKTKSGIESLLDRLIHESKETDKLIEKLEKYIEKLGVAA